MRIRIHLDMYLHTHTYTYTIETNCRTTYTHAQETGERKHLRVEKQISAVVVSKLPNLLPGGNRFDEFYYLTALGYLFFLYFDSGSARRVGPRLTKKERAPIQRDFHDNYKK